MRSAFLCQCNPGAVCSCLLADLTDTLHLSPSLASFPPTKDGAQLSHNACHLDQV